jgi:hypothetical protein
MPKNLETKTTLNLSLEVLIGLKIMNITKKYKKLEQTKVGLILLVG